MKESDIRNKTTLKKYQALVDKDVKKYFKKKIKFKKINYKSWGCKNVKKIFIKKNFIYYQCVETKTIFANPRPGPKTLEDFYANSRSSNFWYNKLFLPKLKNRTQKIFKPRASFFIKKFNKYKKKSFLDIGAGMGIFLTEVKKKWPNGNFYALEPSKALANQCKLNGLKVLQTTIEKLDHKSNKFDVISSFELFEHMFDPKLFLNKVYKLLNKKGIFYFTTLNGMGFDIQALGKNSDAIYPPYHLNFFNPKSIKILMKSIGFRKVEVDTPGELDWNIVENNLSKIEDSSRTLFKYFSRKMTKEKKIIFQNYLKKNNLSSHMRVIATK